MSNELQNQVGRLRVTGEIGEKLDEGLAKAEADVQKIQGARVALRAASEKVRKLHEHVDKDFEEGILDGLSEPNEIRGYAKKYITRAVESLLNLAEKTTVDEAVANGRAVALREAVSIIQRYHQNSRSRVESLLAEMEERAKAAQEGAPLERPPRGGRPSVAERRAAEKKPKVPAKKTARKTRAKKKADA